MHVLISASTQHDSAVRAGLAGSADMYDFFQNVIKIDMFDLAKSLQLYALTRKEGLYSLCPLIFELLSDCASYLSRRYIS